MSELDLAPPLAQRSTLLAFWHALPAITLIVAYFWIALGVLVWVTASMLGAPLWLFVVLVALAAIPGLYVLFHMVRLGIAAERVPD